MVGANHLWADGNPRSRRQLLATVSSVGLLSAAGCSTRESPPSITAPTTALVDESIRIEVGGVEPQTSLDVRASARSRGGTEWVASARFEADSDGTVSLPDRAPADGTYDGVDPMGLFWSMRPDGADPDRLLPPDALFVPAKSAYDVTLVVEVDGEPVAEQTTTRRLFDPDVERRPVTDDALVGEFLVPPGEEPAPAVVHLHGAGGRPHLATGRLLASRGFATLVLQYFGEPDSIPNTLTEVPVEYVETATSWLRTHDRVAGRDVGLFGFSRGGELALLVGSQTDDVGAVVGWVPSGVVWEGLGVGRTPAGTSAWSRDGDPVPFLELADVAPRAPPSPSLSYYEPALAEASSAELDSATIPVENTDAPVYLVSVTDDRRWPSAVLSERVVDRLDRTGYPHEYTHERHAGAGHYLRLPYLPTAGTTRDRYNVYGGRQAANARANAAAWHGTLSFLRRALGGRSPR
ncbi:Acyl-CoA thioester hydrolase/BAAT N-terminal region [Halogranum amylolyticum]|uniref:Acyl-CoA thioester hydrolase/BAAT N-terminal region n=1 Tax=Halogranum amylolyticum TaxID=660520 RepID=A0A1H8MWD4_9EURY|nr:acyl-CoA thioesterase/bile acid-CoA:amino acid N-acyltransferase family protein [Halogranum amylolyticum]SEO21566.1 Acyl-CoA thioester hydrolase/BAAT N-terminal region [Halogranum amylolyticum]